MKLIDKDALVAELKKRIRDYWSDSENTMGIYPYALEEVIKYTDTLEVKEVDLEKEIKEEYLERRHYGGRFNMLIILNESQFNDVAKHFFSLGLNASNPLTWEDMKLIWNITDEMDNMPEEKFYKEVLKRFKKTKR